MIDPQHDDPLSADRLVAGTWIPAPAGLWIGVSDTMAWPIIGYAVDTEQEYRAVIAHQNGKLYMVPADPSMSITLRLN